MNNCYNTRAVTTVEYNDDTRRPVQQISYKGRSGDAELIFPYGFHANVPTETLLTVWHIDGQPSNKVALAGSAEKRIQVKTGEVVMYHPDTKAQVYFQNGGKILVKTGNDKEIEINTGNGSAVINGCTIDKDGNVITKAGTDLDQFKADYDAHTHNYNPGPGSPTPTGTPN